MKASVFSIVFRMILVKKFTIPKIQLSGFRKMCTLRSVASPETQVSFPGKCDASSTIFLLIKISIKICFVRYFFPIKRYFHLYSCICYINGALFRGLQESSRTCCDVCFGLLQLLAREPLSISRSIYHFNLIQVHGRVKIVF